MSFLDRISASVKALTAPEQPTLVAKALPAPIEHKASAAMQASMLYRIGVEHYPPSEYRQLIKRYRTNAIVRRCVEMIAQAVSMIEPVAEINGKQTDRIAEGVQRYLRKPNPAQDRTAFVEALTGFYVLHGNGFVEFAPGMGAYAEFYALRPECMTITPGPSGWPERYTYKPGTGGDMQWPVDIQRGRASILHIKAFSPDDDLWGRGALQSCEKELVTYDTAFDVARAMLANGMTPSGALKYAPRVAPGEPEPRLSDEQYLKLKAQLDQHRRAENRGKPLLLDGGLDWVPFSMTMVEMEAEALRNAAARSIALAFGVPPMLLGIPGDNTYSNYAEANRAFYRQTVLPLAARIYGALGRWWAQLAGQPDLELKIDEAKVWALAEELSALWTRVEASTTLTLNEKREAMGYEPVAPELGDRIYMDGFRQPLDASVRTAEAGAEGAEIGNVSAQVALQYQMENPAYDPAKDRDGDGTSNDGTGTDSTRHAAKPKQEPKA